MDELRLNPVYYGPEHLALRDTLRRFVAREISPHVDAWDEAGGFPRELYARAADVDYSASASRRVRRHCGVDYFHRLIASLELAQCGSGGVVASLMSHTIGSPPVVALGSAELRQRVLPRCSPGAHRGTRHHRAVRWFRRRRPAHQRRARRRSLRAERREDFHHFGMRADYLTVAVRTDPAARGARACRCC